jgi:hypothetical protein
VRPRPSRTAAMIPIRLQPRPDHIEASGPAVHLPHESARPRSSPSAPGLGLPAPAATFRSLFTDLVVVGVVAGPAQGSSQV